MEKRCNKCGKEIGRQDCLEIKKAWGYFSEKDGENHSFQICETCYDALIQEFAIPIEVKERTELL